jgi:hypothetical protein
MSTNVNASAPPSLRDRIRAYAKGGTGVVIAVSIAVGLVCLAVNAIYLSSPDGPVEFGKEAGQFFPGFVGP